MKGETVVIITKFQLFNHINSLFFNLGSGLSSSTAFVCSSTVALMAAFGVEVPKVRSVFVVLLIFQKILINFVVF